MKIDKGIPLPPRKSFYPFSQMEIGDSFYVDIGRNIVSAAATNHGRRHGVKFATRTEGNGTRCWRIK